MAWRLNKSVVRGEIDNRQRDHVTGKFWLVDREFPIMLTLAGNAWRDMAGCLLTFENPNPVDDDNTSLSPVQMGTTGDMTASRKVRVLDIPFEAAHALMARGEPIPEHMGNCIYLEWYSRSNGRVVIESTDYVTTISPHQWRMTKDEEAALVAKNSEAAMSWVEEIAAEMAGDDLFSVEDLFSDDDDDDWEMDEFEWEKQLKESDAMTERYGELLKKYMDDPNREAIIAREMGWSWLEDALEDEDEDEDEDDPPWMLDQDLDLDLGDDDFEMAPNPLTEGTDWVRTAKGRVKHPLAEKAYHTGMDMWQYCKDLDLLGEEGDPDLHDMIFQAQTLAAKLSGALNPLAYRNAPDSGFIVACLKRSLQYFDNAIRAAALVSEKTLVAEERVAAFRNSLFQIRQEILSLMTHYRQLR
jgi:hypothetical protein